MGLQYYIYIYKYTLSDICRIFDYTTINGGAIAGLIATILAE
jgi:hypothetical protein